MATESGVTERCLLCGRELPRGGFSARVTGVLLTPLCEDCERQCSKDPNTVVAQHPRLFERPAQKETYVPDVPSVVETGSTGRAVSPSLVTQPGLYSNVPSSALSQVVVTDIKMSFSSMVVFMVKWAIASIPALIILILIGIVFSGVFGSLLLGLGSRPFFR
jgi:hypothetical protein